MFSVNLLHYFKQLFIKSAYFLQLFSNSVSRKGWSMGVAISRLDLFVVVSFKSGMHTTYT